MDQNSTFAKPRHAGSVCAVVLLAALAFGAVATQAQSAPPPSETAEAEQVSFATVPAASRPTAAAAGSQRRFIAR